MFTNEAGVAAYMPDIEPIQWLDGQMNVITKSLIFIDFGRFGKTKG